MAQSLLQVITPVQPQVTSAEQYLNRVLNLNTMMLNQRKRNLTMLFNQFWSSREFAQSVCDKLGINAKKLFDDSLAEQMAIKALDDTWEFLVPPFPYTTGEDGTVTIEQ